MIQDIDVGDGRDVRPMRAMASKLCRKPGTTRTTPPAFSPKMDLPKKSRTFTMRFKLAM